MRRYYLCSINKRLKEPIIRESGDFVDVEIYIEIPENAGKVPEAYEDLSEQEKTIILYSKDNGKVTSKEVMQILGIKDRRARKILRDMVDKNLIEIKGRGKHTHYVIAT